MTQRTEHWLQERSQHWQKTEEILPQLEDNKPVSFQQLRKIIHIYPELARDVAQMRRDAPGTRTTLYLESIYQRCHRVLFRPPRAGAREFISLLREEIPDIAFHLRWTILFVTLGFIFSATAGWWLVGQFPELATLFASEQMIEQVQQGELWTDGLLNVIPSSVLSIQILTNNIMVSLTAMCLGVLYGLGTLYIIGLNGLMLGGIFAMTAQYAMAPKLFDFIIAHGCVELSVIMVAGAIGFSIGESLARPGMQSRGSAFRVAVQRGTKLMALCVIFLVGAGFIEGYISPNEIYTRDVRIAVGVAYWALFVFALCGWRIPKFTRSDAGPSTIGTH